MFIILFIISIGLKKLNIEKKNNKSVKNSSDPNS